LLHLTKKQQTNPRTKRIATRDLAKTKINGQTQNGKRDKQMLAEKCQKRTAEKPQQRGEGKRLPKRKKRGKRKPGPGDIANQHSLIRRPSFRFFAREKAPKKKKDAAQGN